MTFTDGVKKISYQTPYKMSKFKGIDCEGLDELSSQIVLCDDDVRRGCTNTLDLLSGFFKDVDKLGSKYHINPFNFKDPRYLNYESDYASGSEYDLDLGTDDGVT